MVKQPVLAAIRWYQGKGGSRHFFSLECNFEPTCSEYTHQAISKYGLTKGIFKGLKRIKRCSDPDCVQTLHDPLI